MRTVIEGRKEIVDLLGKQSRKGTVYRMMKYVLRAECRDGTLLQNVITGEIVHLDETESQMLCQLPSEHVDSELIKDYFLVPEGHDEKQDVENLRKLLRKLYPVKGINGYMILPTTGCNARCPYCFEKDIRPVHMDAKTADRVIEYIALHKDKGSVHIHWFGGEPLLGRIRIQQICEGLHNRGIPFDSIMTTNGLLFTEETVKQAVTEWHLMKIQISLDGTEEIYNRIKGYIGYEGSAYQQVMNNIELLLKSKVQVNLRLNLDNQHTDDVKRLVRELGSRYCRFDSLAVYPAVLLEGTRSSFEEEFGRIFQQQNELDDWIKESGLRRRFLRRTSLRVTKCIADSEDSVVIHPDGKLSKCEYITDDDSFGDIWNEQRESTAIEKYRKAIEFDRCTDCPLFPACIILTHCPCNGNQSEEFCEKSVLREKEKMVFVYEAGMGGAQSEPVAVIP